MQKIKNRESGILVYGITPPKKITPSEKVIESAKRTIERVKSLPIDALIVYDVQDESTRTKEERPFPFQASIDPLAFVKEHLNELAVEKIIYRPAGIYSEAELSEWFKNLHEQKAHPVLVGIPS
ncbi:MAG: 5,10-methylenetetrahydrofolate reductase, partial [Flavobacteriales bacterium]